MNALNTKSYLSPSNFSISLNLLTCKTCSPSKLNVILDPHLLSLLLAHQLYSSSSKITSRSFSYHHLPSGINFLTHFVSHALICLFLIHHSTIISLPECHHHHSHHPSPHHSSLPTSKLFLFLPFTLHGHLAPLRTDFMDIRTVVRFLRFISSF